MNKRLSFSIQSICKTYSHENKNNTNIKCHKYDTLSRHVYIYDISARDNKPNNENSDEKGKKMK